MSMTYNKRDFHFYIIIDNWNYNFIKETKPFSERVPDEAKNDKVLKLLETDSIILFGRMQGQLLPREYLRDNGFESFRGKTEFLPDFIDADRLQTFEVWSEATNYLEERLLRFQSARISRTAGKHDAEGMTSSLGLDAAFSNSIKTISEWGHYRDVGGKSYKQIYSELIKAKGEGLNDDEMKFTYAKFGKVA